MILENWVRDCDQCAKIKLCLLNGSLVYNTTLDFGVIFTKRCINSANWLNIYMLYNSA